MVLDDNITPIAVPLDGCCRVMWMMMDLTKLNITLPKLIAMDSPDIRCKRPFQVLTCLNAAWQVGQYFPCTSHRDKTGCSCR